MKTLYLIGGTMGVGKTTVAGCLKTMLDKSVMLDGDWCWDMHPFVVSDVTKRLVMDNIRALLRNFLNCPEIENVVFCWVMHEQQIIEDILASLPLEECRVVTISLMASEDTLRTRLQTDVDAGKRQAEVIARSVARLPLYEGLSTVKIPTDGKAPEAIAAEISSI